MWVQAISAGLNCSGKFMVGAWCYPIEVGSLTWQTEFLQKCTFSGAHDIVKHQLITGKWRMLIEGCLIPIMGIPPLGWARCGMLCSVYPNHLSSLATHYFHNIGTYLYFCLLPKCVLISKSWEKKKITLIGAKEPASSQLWYYTTLARRTWPISIGDCNSLIPVPYHRYIVVYSCY